MRTLLLSVGTELRVRVRHPGFLPLLLGAGLLCFSIAAGDLALSWGGYRGAPTAGWIGVNGAVVSLLLLSLAGFYLVRDAVGRDRRLGVDRMWGSSPVSRLTYFSSKIAGNLAYLLLLGSLPVVLTTAQWITRPAGAITGSGLVELWYPFLILVLPVLVGVAGLAVVFDVVPALRGAAGNLFYLLIWALLVAASNQTQPGGLDLVGLGIIKPLIRDAVIAQHPGATGFFDIGTRQPAGTFLWTGLPTNPRLIAERLLWLIPGFFPLVLMPWLGIASRRPPASSRHPGRLSEWIEAVHLGLARLELVRYLPNPPFGRLVLGEVVVGIKGRSGWWVIGALALVGASLLAPLQNVISVWYPLAALWVLPVLSGFGNRERRANTAPVLYGVARPVGRHLTATLASGVLLSALLLGGSALRAGWAGMAAPATGALLSILALPAIALGLGVSTGNNRPFEFFFVLAWYLGPIRGAEQLDFLGRSSSGSALGVIPWLALGLGALGFLARARQLRTGHLA